MCRQGHFDDGVRTYHPIADCLLTLTIYLHIVIMKATPTTRTESNPDARPVQRVFAMLCPSVKSCMTPYSRNRSPETVVPTATNGL